MKLRHALDTLARLAIHPLVVAATVSAAVAALFLVERELRNMPFILAVGLCIAVVIGLPTRRPRFAAYATVATMLTIAAASVVKYRMKGFDLHVYDFGFTGGDTDAAMFLVAEYPGLVVPILAAIATAVLGLALVYRAEPEITGERLAATAWLMPAAALGLIAGYPLKQEEPRYFHYVSGFNGSAFYVSLLDLQYLFTATRLEERLRETAPQPAFSRATACEGPKPDIVLVLSESHVDPAVLPGVENAPDLSRSFASDDGRKRDMFVETFGGGTWVTHLSLLTSLSAADFDFMGPYLTTHLDGKVKGALPQVLSDCGYRTAALLPMKDGFVNEGPFLRSIGVETVLDYDAIGASEYAHRDRFYFDRAAGFIKQHRQDDGRPLFLTIATMFAHSPYDGPAAEGPQEIASDIAGDPETNEYMRRVAISRGDLERFLQRLKTGRPTVAVEYGDHHPYISRKALDAAAERNTLADLRSDAYRTHFAVHSFGHPLDMDAFGEGPLDVGFLAASLLEAAGLPSSEMFTELARLRRLCAGRFHDCKDRAIIDRHLRRRVDSGLLALF
ncbi:MAG: sulfatase-like hydrolase/transferase [Rhizobiaceae bacterium]|nr:sulfatase-like hydrolase/transferase [Rhizobiaceae bacterium]MCV0408459.1 sulfatase-like hydrolase/transferase [Rhizobiaceae bacterium]